MASLITSFSRLEGSQAPVSVNPSSVSTGNISPRKVPIRPLRLPVWPHSKDDPAFIGEVRFSLDDIWQMGFYKFVNLQMMIQRLSLQHRPQIQGLTIRKRVSQFKNYLSLFTSLN